MKKQIKRFINLFKTKNYIPIYELKNDKNLLEGNVALITGGSGGIGFAIAKSFAESGCKVIIAGTNEKKLIDNCVKIGANSKYIILDINDVSSFDATILDAHKLFGKIDILVNCAGVHTPRKGADFMNFTEEEYDKVMNVNLKGTYFFTQAMSKYFIKNSIHAHILFISSSTAIEPAWSPYRLSKWGIKGMIPGIAQKLLKNGIVVNGIAPGSTATKLLDFEEGDSIYTTENSNERYVMPEEVANMSKMLVSSAGDMIVGETIYMSGGRGTIELR
nr:SDR family oxidoreductase [Bacilli bacterium]